LSVVSNGDERHYVDRSFGGAGFAAILSGRLLGRLVRLIVIAVAVRTLEVPLKGQSSHSFVGVCRFGDF
jgi:hypothetical protein